VTGRQHRRRGGREAFAVLTGVRAMIETLPRERTEEAYQKMLSGKARFRMVITS